MFLESNMTYISPMVERMPYTLLESREGYELRRYDVCVLATIHVFAELESAANIGFGPLVGYISGSNVSGEKMAMTSPVVQVATTQPGYDISFVLPQSIGVSEIPVPYDSRIITSILPDRVMATIRYRGRWSESRFMAAAERLMSCLARDGIEISGPPQWARFDPPWVPPVLRTNEILAPVRLSA